MLAVLGLALAQAALADEWIYTAHEGDTLLGLAETYTKRLDYWHGMQSLNHIADPRKIPTGTRIHIPVDWLKFEPAPVKVVQTHGPCDVIHANGPQETAREGMELHNGDQVRTGPEGNMSLEFADGSKLLVRAQSQLALDSISIFREGTMVDMHLRLEQGDVDSQVVPAPAGISPRFRINTPSAVAAVRGTDFRVGTETENQAMRNETLEGRVEVAGAGGRRLVPAGFGVVAGPGRGPQAPRKLLEAPQLEGLPAVVDALPVAFSWPKQDGEAGYRAQVAPNGRFETLLSDQKVTTANAQFGDLPDGEYVLRIRGIAAVGLEGLDATHPFTVNARPEPPVAAAPKDGGKAYTHRPKFWWSKPHEAEYYHIQVSAQPDFQSLLADQPKVESTDLVLEQDLPLGPYYWRVATIDGQHEHGPWGSVQSFTVMEPAAAPEGPEAELADQTISFKWKPVKEAARYQFQLAEDEEFSEELLDKETPENKISLTQEDFASGGDHYFRTRAITEDGSPGAWSVVNEIDIPGKLSPLWLLMLTLVLIPILL